MSGRRWKVMPCPEHGASHPYHAHRLVVTADAELVEREEGAAPEEWELASGSCVCVMRDVDPAWARMVAAAPMMLEALQRLGHPMADDEDLEFAAAAIRAAKGEHFELAKREVEFGLGERGER